MITQTLRRDHVMTDKQNGPSLFGYLAHFSQAFFLERRISNREHLVYNKNLGFEVGSHGESQPHIHTSRIVFDRCVYEPFHLGESDDFIELSFYLYSSHSQYGAIEENIFSSGEFRVKSRANLEQAPDLAIDFYPAFGWLSNAGEDFQQR